MSSSKPLTSAIVKNSKNSRQVTRVMSFTSGKGGVGKTSLVVNTAIAIARLGKSVLILDGDLGLANVDVMLGLRPKYTLLDVFEGRKNLQDILITGPEGISIIPATSGNESMCNLDTERRMLLMQAVESMPFSFDYVLVDTPAGIGPDVMYFNGASTEIVCVINGEPTSLTDTYALMKLMATEYGEKEFSVIANNVPNENEAKAAFGRLERAGERFLHLNLNYLGFVPEDDALCEAVKNQRALLELFPTSPAGRAITAVTKKIDASFIEARVKGGMQFFFQQLLELSADQGR